MSMCMFVYVCIYEGQTLTQYLLFLILKNIYLFLFICMCVCVHA